MSAESKKRIIAIQEELERIEQLILQKPKLERQLAALQREVEAAQEAGEVEAEEEVEEEEVVPEPEPVQVAVPELSPEEQRKKKIKALNKKLQQIQALKDKGGDLDPEAAAKVSKEAIILKQVQLLKEGKDLPEEEQVREEVQQNSAEVIRTALPKDSAEREKRARTLKKKLQQIAALKEKDGQLDKEAQEKVASERAVKLEIEALERGDAELVIGPLTEHEKHEAWLEQKHDLERKIKAVTKKISAIESHKERSDLDHEKHAQAKVENEASLKKERGDLERQLGILNKQEQLRTAQRLGFEDDHHAANEEKKQAKKKKGR